MSDDEISRRAFVKEAGVAAGAALLGTTVTGGETGAGGFDTTSANVRGREARKAWARGFRGRPDRSIGLTDSGVDARPPDLDPWNGVSIEQTSDGYELQQVTLGDATTTGQALLVAGTASEFSNAVAAFVGTDDDVVVGASTNVDEAGSGTDDRGTMLRGGFGLR